MLDRVEQSKKGEERRGGEEEREEEREEEEVRVKIIRHSESATQNESGHPVDLVSGFYYFLIYIILFYISLIWVYLLKE
jgi:hypothetical protein